MNESFEFSSLEKQSMYQILCGTSMVDGNRDIREIMLINEIVDTLGITEAEIKSSRTLDMQTQLSVLKSMSQAKKMMLSSLMCQVIIADGVIDPKEESFFNYYRQLLDLPVIE